LSAYHPTVETVGFPGLRLVKTNTVWSYLPYSKGMYNQEYPTINAIRVRNSKRKAKEKALTCTDTAQNEGSGAC